MRYLGLILPLLTLASAVVLLAQEPPVKARVGNEATPITGPLDKDGFIDYEAALNAKLKGKATAESNAVVLMLKAIGPRPEGSPLHADFYKLLGIEPLPEKGDYLLRYGDFFGDEIRADENQSFFDREGELRTKPWTAQEEPKFAEYLTVNEKPLKLMTEAVKRPDYFHPLISRIETGERGVLIGCLLSMVQKMRETASILGLRVMLHCGSKNYEAAWQDILTLHRLARQVAKGGTLIELLVGIAIDAIARGISLRFLNIAQPDARTAQAYRADLDKLPPMPTVHEKIDLLERFTFLDYCQINRRNGMANLTGLLREIFDVQKETIEGTFGRLDWKVVLKRGNDWYDRIITASKKPTRSVRLKEYEALEADMKKMKQGLKFEDILRESNDNEKIASASARMGDAIMACLLPGVTKIREATDRNQMDFATEKLAFSLAGYYAEHKKYPAKLSELVPKYADNIPVDLYSEKDLIYKPSARGYELYSVGRNGKDDGCHLMMDEPFGDDLGVRMPYIKKVWVKPDDDGTATK